MKRFLVLPLLFLLATCVFGTHVNTSGLGSIADSTGDKYCSCFNVKGTNLYMTAEHCIEKGMKVVVNGELVEPKVLVANKDTDVAVLEAKGMTVGYVIDSKEPEPGDELIALGLTGDPVRGGITPVVTRGIAGFLNSEGMLQMDITLHPGMSGGPIMKGDKVVTIVSKGFPTRGGWVMFSPTNAMLRAALMQALTN